MSLSQSTADWNRQLSARASRTSTPRHAIRMILHALLRLHTFSRQTRPDVCEVLGPPESCRRRRLLRPSTADATLRGRLGGSIHSSGAETVAQPVSFGQHDTKENQPRAASSHFLLACRPWHRKLDPQPPWMGSGLGRFPAGIRRLCQRLLLSSCPQGEMAGV